MNYYFIEGDGPFERTSAIVFASSLGKAKRLANRFVCNIQSARLITECVIHDPNVLEGIKARGAWAMDYLINVGTITSPEYRPSGKHKEISQLCAAAMADLGYHKFISEETI